MMHTMIVWGFDPKDPACSYQADVFIDHGCRHDGSGFNLKYLGSAAWFAFEFPSFADAEACGAEIHERYPHLQMLMEPNWRAFGENTETATALLIRLAEKLGCREQPSKLSGLGAAVLTRGVPTVLAAVAKIGGASALELIDKDAAHCLANSLMEVVYHLRSVVLTQVEADCMLLSFGALGPPMLAGAAAELRKDAPGAAVRACAAARLTQSELGNETDMATDNGSRPEDQYQLLQQETIASDCVALLRAVTRALAECCTAIGLGTPANGAARNRPQPRWKMLQLGERCTVLQMTAQALVNSLRSRVLRGGIPERQLLAALGRLTQQIVVCAETEALTAVAGVRPADSGGQDLACLRELHVSLSLLLPSIDKAELAVLHIALTAALRMALNRLASPQHIGRLLGLALIAQDMTRNLGPADADTRGDWVAQLSRLQLLAAKWLAADPQQLLQEACAGHWDEHEQFALGVSDLHDQLCLLADYNLLTLGAEVAGLLTKCSPSANTPDVDSVVSLKTLHALTATLKEASAARFWNARGRGWSLGLVECSGYHRAPGLYMIADALFALACKLDASAGAANRQPWVAATTRQLLLAGMDILCLVDKEAAAQAASPSRQPAAAREAARLRNEFRHQGAKIICLATHYVTPGLAQTLVQEAVPMIQLLRTLELPERISAAEFAADVAAWDSSMHAVRAACQLLAVLLPADAQSREMLLKDGGWHRGFVRSVRSHQPPASRAAAWPKQREAMLQRVSVVLEGGDGGSRPPSASGSSRPAGAGVGSRPASAGGTGRPASDGGRAAAADAEAVAAADRVMQELLIEEQAPEAPAPRSKAAAKRARKKAAKRQAAAAAAVDDAQAAPSTTQPAAAVASAAEPHEPAVARGSDDPGADVMWAAAFAAAAPDSTAKPQEPTATEHSDSPPTDAMWPAAFAATPQAAADVASDSSAEPQDLELDWRSHSPQADAMWPAAFAAVPKVAAGDASDSPAEPQELDWSSDSSEADAPWPDAAGAEPPAAADAAPDSTGMGPPPPQQPAAAVDMAGADWWRCPLSGEAMRDPVLWGAEGQSFERVALQEWLAAHPGVHPLTRQAVPPEACSVLPNRALRDLLQQLQLG